MTTTLADPHAERDLTEFLPDGGRVFPVGRLDRDSEGLILLTNDGDWAQRVLHPRFEVEREYAVRVLGTLEKEARERLLAGVEIEGQAAAFKSIEDGGGEGVNHWYRVVITEGRNRQVRRMCEAIDHPVIKLMRTRYGGLNLGRLQRGEYRALASSEISRLEQLAGVTR